MVRNFSEFMNLVSPLRFDDFEMVEVIPNTHIGLFDRHRFSELTEFCKRFPEYHIVSNVSPGVFLNTGVDNSIQYILADGNSDPNLAYAPQLSSINYFELQVLKLWGS